MLTPISEQNLTFHSHARRMRVLAAGHVIADTEHPVLLQDEGGSTVFFPREDVEMNFLSQTDKTTHRERLGDAIHFTMLIDGELLENVACSYPQPYGDLGILRDLVAFDATRVEVYEVTEDELKARHHPHTGPATSLP